MVGPVGNLAPWGSPENTAPVYVARHGAGTTHRWILSLGGPMPNLTAEDRTHLARERRARRKAKRLDLQLIKSKSRNPMAPDFGRYWLANPWNNTIVAGHDVGMSLEETEAALAE